MAKTSYIVVINPAYDFIEADNPELAEALYRSKNRDAHDIAIVPRSAFKLNGKRIPYSTSTSDIKKLRLYRCRKCGYENTTDNVLVSGIRCEKCKNGTFDFIKIV